MSQPLQSRHLPARWIIPFAAVPAIALVLVGVVLAQTPRGYEPPPPPEQPPLDLRRVVPAEREAPALPYNAVVTRGDQVLPVYPANRAHTAGVAFSYANGVLTAKDPERELW